MVYTAGVTKPLNHGSLSVAKIIHDNWALAPKLSGTSSDTFPKCIRL